MDSRRSWLVYGVGVFAYIAAITQRTTIGVTGVAAEQRFHTSAALLSTLAVVQLVVYAGAQLPVGVLLDRFGPRRLMIVGTALMAAGQLLVAVAETLGLAVTGRVLVGAGDAMIFISLVRATNSWFSERRVPQLTQWISTIGQLGQVLSAVPFAFVLRENGWAVAFVSAAAFAVLAVVGLIIALRDRPAGSGEPARHASVRHAMRQLGESLRRPGTQLGFWAHFITQSSGTTFSLMWGVPFLEYSFGMPAASASAMLLIIVATGIVVGPALGVLSARYPLRRSNLVLGITFAILAMWAIVLSWPGLPPLWLIVVLLVVIGAGGPGSVIGFDFARSFNPIHSLGSANGVVNVGGFSASFIMIFAIGVLLDAAHAMFGVAVYSLDAFRLAFCVQFVVIGVGIVLLLAARRRTRRRLNDDEGITVAPLWVVWGDALNARAQRRATPQRSAQR